MPTCTKDRPQSMLDIINQARYLTAERREHVLAFLIDAKKQIISIEKVSIGTTIMSLAHPRDIFRPALMKEAVAVILVHNHPSGDPTPSEEDVRLTKRVAQAGYIVGVELLDHIIVATNGSYSMRTSGDLPNF